MLENRSDYKIYGKIMLKDGAYLFFSETDPMLGIPSPLSSFCWYGNQLYIKVGIGDEDWELFLERFQQLEFTGFISFTGAGDYWSVTGDQFTLLRGGVGRIQTTRVDWLANQTVTLASGECNYIGIGSDGLLFSTTTPNFQTTINLFEAVYTGSVVKVVKENHPYNFPSTVSHVLHSVTGTVFHGKAGALQAATTGAGNTAAHRQVNFVGEDVLEDHGLSTTISATSPITWGVWYKNNLGKWTRYASSTELTNIYVNAGVVTTSQDKRSIVYTLYVTKDNLNTNAPQFIAVPYTTQYGNLADAQTAIGNGLFPVIDNELKKLEAAQIGFAVVRRQAGNVYIEWVTTAKDTAGLRIAQLGSTGNHLLLGDTQGGQYGDGGHYNLTSWVSGAGQPTVTDDIDTVKPMTLWRNTTTREVSLCLDNTDAASKWVGLLNGVKVWETGKYYVKGMVVTWGGFLFRVEETHTSVAWDLSKVIGLDCEIALEGYGTLDVVYRGAGGWELARADDADTLSEPVHIVLMGDGTRSLIVSGGRKVTIIGHGLTGTQYLSTITAGEVTSTKPTTGFLQSIYHVVDADVLMVLNSEGVEL